MTLSDDLNFSESGGFDDSSSSYPVVFGITLTPIVIGATIAGLGFLGAVYMVLNMVMPSWGKLQTAQKTYKELEQDVKTKTEQSKKAPEVKQKLADAKKSQVQVLGLFANEDSLDTLLIDTSRLVDSSNAQVVGSNGITAQLKKFTPQGDETEIIDDSSLGSKVNNKLKRQIIDVEIDGNFEQMRTIMANIERLQPLLLVQNYNSRLVPPEIEKSDDDQPGVRTGIGKLSTSFELVALMPLNEKEAAKIAAEEAAKKAKQKK